MKQWVDDRKRYGWLGLTLADLFGDGDGERDLPVGLLLVTDGGNAGALDEGQTLGQATEEAPHVRCFGGRGYGQL